MGQVCESQGARMKGRKQAAEGGINAPQASCAGAEVRSGMGRARCGQMWGKGWVVHGVGRCGARDGSCTVWADVGRGRGRARCGQMWGKGGVVHGVGRCGAREGSCT
eukprot:366169-Chlamydomonas_euryale.AAC.1